MYFFYVRCERIRRGWYRPMRFARRGPPSAATCQNLRYGKRIAHVSWMKSNLIALLDRVVMQSCSSRLV